MTPAETAELLGMCAAFDRRTVGRADVTAWHLVLHDVDFSDAQQAVAAHYRDHREWIMPSDVRTGVRRIRNARIEASNPLYDGDPHETPEQALRGLRALLHDAGSGRLPAQPIRLALESGETKAEPGARMKAMLKAAVHAVPGPRAGVVNVLAVPCPHCAAPAGKTCVSGRRKQRRHADAHPSRLDAARRTAAELPDDVA